MANVLISQGEAEQKLVDLAESKPESFELFIARPGKVHPNDTWIPDQLLWLLYAVRQDQLAAVLVDIAVNGSPKKLVLRSRSGIKGCGAHGSISEQLISGGALLIEFAVRRAGEE